MAIANKFLGFIETDMILNIGFSYSRKKVVNSRKNLDKMRRNGPVY